MSYTVYILYASDIDKYYIGYTNDKPEERLRRHLNTRFGFTARSKQWKIIFKETFDNKTDAIRREREIKSWKSRIRIEQLLKG